MHVQCVQAENPDVFIGGENYLALWNLFEFEEAMKVGWKMHNANAK